MWSGVEENGDMVLLCHIVILCNYFGHYYLGVIGFVRFGIWIFVERYIEREMRVMI